MIDITNRLFVIHSNMNRIQFSDNIVNIERFVVNFHRMWDRSTDPNATLNCQYRFCTNPLMNPKFSTFDDENFIHTYITHIVFSFQTKRSLDCRFFIKYFIYFICKWVELCSSIIILFNRRLILNISSI